MSFKVFSNLKVSHKTYDFKLIFKYDDNALGNMYFKVLHKITSPLVDSWYIIKNSKLIK